MSKTLNPLDRVPPHNLDTEKACIGSMMGDAMVANDCLAIVTPDDFYSHAHRLLVKTISRMVSENQPLDYWLFIEQLKRDGSLKDVGGEDYLIEVAKSVVSPANGEYYASVVADKAMLRNFVATAGDLIRDALAEDSDVTEFLGRAEQAIFRVTEKKSTGKLSAVKDILKDVWQDIESGGEEPGIPTGLIELDSVIGGFKPAQMIVVGARTSVGKSAFGATLLLNAALRHGKRVALFSMEMRKKEIVKRMLSSESGIPLNQFGKGVLTPGAFESLQAANAEFQKAEIFIDDVAGQNIFDIRAKCRRLAATGGLDLVVIDYLQKMELPRRSENRQTEVSAISRAVCALGHELSVPVVALSQLNRDSEVGDRLPRLSDLRESGSIEMDADTVLLLHRPLVSDAANGLDESDATVIVAKQRNGPTGILKLQFQGQCVRFVNSQRGGL